MLSTLRRAPLWLLPPLLAGAALRLWGLDRQILAGDELHAVRVALGESLGPILTTYRIPDPSIPLAVWNRLVLLATGELSALWVRLPAVMAGLATPALALLAERPFGRRTAAATAWLLAVSPLLVYYGRIGRPYAPVVVLGVVAVAAFWRFWEGRSRRTLHGGLYAAAAGLLVWLHPGTALYAAAPLAWAAGDLALGRRRVGRLDRRRAAALAGAAAGAAGAVALVLLPGAASLGEVLGDRGGAGLFVAAGWTGAAELLAGSARPWAAALFWLLAAAGAAALARRRPRLASFLGWLVVVQVAAVLVFRPYAMQVSVVLARYLLVALPAVLVAAGAGIVLLAGGIAGGRPALGRMIAAALVAALALAGPHAADPALRFGPFAGSNAAAEFQLPPPRLAADAVPPVYRVLAAEPGGPLVEAIWWPVWAVLQAPFALQSHHRRDVIVAIPPGLILADSRLRTPTLVAARPEELLASAGSWLVVHHEPLALTERVEHLAFPGFDAENRLRGDSGRDLSARLRERWGEPHLTDGAVEAWDLDRVRAALSRRGGEGTGGRPGGRRAGSSPGAGGGRTSGRS